MSLLKISHLKRILSPESKKGRFKIFLSLFFVDILNGDSSGELTDPIRSVQAGPTGFRTMKRVCRRISRGGLSWQVNLCIYEGFTS
jgi:hypothetical protein